LEKVDYDKRLHLDYAAGRQMLPSALQAWMAALARHLPGDRPLVWLDLGSGTGRMTPSLASTFGAAYGVEPSPKMRAQAVASSAQVVTYLEGSAEHIPLPDASCDAALVFFVWHHVTDRGRAARELRRVVKPGGKVFIAGNLADKMPDVWWFRIVPEWRILDTSQFPSEEEVRGTLVAAGWTFAARDEVSWVRSASMDEDLEKLKLRSVSFFEHASDEVVRAGFARIEVAMPSLEDGPQLETNQLLVFEH
jgi:SAM-dependent methyltransferase